MNLDDIIRMAEHAGFETLLPHEHIHGTGGVYVGDENIAEMLERFANLVATAEREACAKLVFQTQESDDEYVSLREKIAFEINARGLVLGGQE